MNAAEFEYEQLYDFLLSIDKDFPVPLSNKVNISEWTKKLLDRATICAAIIDGEIASAVAGYTDNLIDETAYIAMVGTRKSYRGKKLARKNVRDFMEVCREKNIPRVHLYVDPENEVAKKMYYELGFVEYVIQNELRPDDIHLIYNL